MDDTMSSALASDPPHLPSLQDEPGENQNPYF
jgi:hypothetical protein